MDLICLCLPSTSHMLDSFMEQASIGSSLLLVHGTRSFDFAHVGFVHGTVPSFSSTSSHVTYSPTATWGMISLKSTSSGVE